MKILLVLLIPLFAMTKTFAQQQDPDKQKVFYLMKVEKYNRMKRTGAVLTVCGGILTVIGVANLSNSTPTTTYNSAGYPTTTTGSPEGAAAFLLGITGLGAGVPLWIVGAHAARKYQYKLEGISVRVNVAEQQTGLTLTYRF